MAKKYKIMLISVTILLIASIFLGTSYSLWTTTKVQEGTNEVNIGCFSVTFTNLDSYGGNEAGDINLVNAYPITDEAGSALTPYVFKIKNTCTIASDYTINLETLNTSNFNLDYLKVKFNEASNNTSTPTIYSSLDNGTIMLTAESSAAKLLTTGYLAPNEEITYALRAWIDNSATTETSNVMGKTWNGKVVVSNEAGKAESVSGTRVAYITDGADAKIKNLEITGGTENSINVGQDGTLDIVVSGKNLFDYRKLNNNIYNGVTLTNNNDGSFTFSGTKTDLTHDIALSFSLSHNETINTIFEPGSYVVSNSDCNGNILYIKNPCLFIDQFYNNSSNDDKYSFKSHNNTSSIFTFTNNHFIYDDFYIKVGLYIWPNMDVATGTYCPQLEYNDHATEFEPYKERRYTIELKDTSNNTINGLSSSDTLKKVNGVWVIDNGTNQTQLADATQNVLNTISTYSGISRIWVDDDVLITGINATYTKSNS